jgi:hypothetical protein
MLGTYRLGLATAKIPCRRPVRNFQKGSERDIFVALYAIKISKLQRSGIFPKRGGTGNLPVPVGNLPTGMTKDRPSSKHQFWK